MEPAYVTHIRKLKDDWGLGQIDIGIIQKMMKVGKEIGLDFTVAKKVTAVDKESLEERTITAGEGYLFVYPSDNRDLINFWSEVERTY